MHRIVILPTAENDLNSAVDYLTDVLFAPKAAYDLVEKFKSTVLRIAEFPYAFELYRSDYPLKDEIRKVTVNNYVLYYAVFEDYVEIRRFIHGRMNRSQINF